MKNIRHIALTIVSVVLMSCAITLAGAQPYYDAYFTSIMVTNGNDSIELVSGGTAKVYDGQEVWTNLTFYNSNCGLPWGYLYTKIYEGGVLIGTSDERIVWLSSTSQDLRHSMAIGGPTTKNYKVELWWESAGTHYLEDERTFSIKVVKLSVTDWSVPSLSVEKGKTTAVTLSLSFKNGGNDYMYDAKISLIDSAGLVITPQSQLLEDITSGGTKSASFFVTAPSTVSTGTKGVSFKVEYDDFIGISHFETKTASITVGLLSTSITIGTQPSSVKKGDSTTVTARLLDGNSNSLAGKDVDFSIGTTSVGTAITDSLGNAIITYAVNLDEGTHTIEASFDGSIDYSLSTATCNLVVNPFTTTLTIDIPSAMQGKSCTIEATLKDENGNPLPNANVEFQLLANSGTWTTIGSDTTDSGGIASIDYTPSSTGTFQVRAVFNAVTNYAESNSTPTGLIVAADYTLVYVGAGIIAIAVLGVVGYMVFRRRRKTTPKT